LVIFVCPVPFVLQCLYCNVCYLCLGFVYSAFASTQVLGLDQLISTESFASGMLCTVLALCFASGGNGQEWLHVAAALYLSLPG
jgi:hypothetical protein